LTWFRRCECQYLLIDKRRTILTDGRSKKWQEVIDGSITLQRKLFLAPADTTTTGGERGLINPVFFKKSWAASTPMLWYEVDHDCPILRLS